MSFSFASDEMRKAPRYIYVRSPTVTRARCRCKFGKPLSRALPCTLVVTNVPFGSRANAADRKGLLARCTREVEKTRLRAMSVCTRRMYVYTSARVCTPRPVKSRSAVSGDFFFLSFFYLSPSLSLFFFVASSSILLVARGRHRCSVTSSSSGAFIFHNERQTRRKKTG